MTMTLHPLLAEASFTKAIGSFLDFIQLLCLLFALGVLVHGVSSVSRGDTSDGYSKIAGAFVMAAAVIIVRMIAGWMGVTL